jgi:hypothetical protein
MVVKGGAGVKRPRGCGQRGLDFRAGHNSASRMKAM